MRVLIMAGGTGGHIFPALAVARHLREAGAEVLWLGARDGLETRLVPRAGIELATIRVRGLRGRGLLGRLGFPVRLAVAMGGAVAVILRFRPLVLLGMGGFASGPGGLVAALLHRPLVIHEQNAVAGLTNRWLARVATQRLTGFAGALPRATHVGNPVRDDIGALPPPGVRLAGRKGRLRLLVLGGSQGARSLNEAVPAVLGALPVDRRPRVHHQCGRGAADEVRRRYVEARVEARVEPFIEDMAAAYGWADLAVCRAGALTLAELAASGLGAVLVPYPWAVDDHQRHNAEPFVEEGAARRLTEGPAFAERLAETLADLLGGEASRPRLTAMASAARGLARPDAAAEVARICMEVGRHG